MLFRLKPPAGLIPPAPADQTTRAIALITWAEWEGGIGLERISEELGRVGRSSLRMGSQASGDTPPPAGQSPADPPESGQNSGSNTSPPGGQVPPSSGALGTYQWHAFVSHSSNDKPWVRKLVARLRADGFNIWMDEDNIEAGGAIQRSVEEGLAQSRDLILIMSKHSVGTDQGPGSGWVELETLIRTTFDPSSRVRRVLPLKIGPCKVPLSIRPFRYLEVETQTQLDAEYPRIVAALRREVVPPPPPPKPWWKRWGWVVVAGVLTLVIGAYLARGEVAPSAVAPNSRNGDTQLQRPGRQVQALTTPIPLTLVWVEGGTEAGGAPDPASGTSALRRYLGGHLIPALVRAGVRGITLDISLHPDGGSGDLEPYRSALQQAHDAGILIAAPWPSAAHAPLIDECPTPGQGACFDRLLSTWVGEGPISHLPTCPTDRMSPAMMLSWLLPNRVNRGARLGPGDLIGLTCQSSQIEVRGPLPRPRPWEEVSSRLILEQEPGALGQVHDRVILVGQHSADDTHPVVTPTGVEQIQGVELHALATQHLYLAQFSPASPERP